MLTPAASIAALRSLASGCEDRVGTDQVPRLCREQPGRQPWRGDQQDETSHPQLAVRTGGPGSPRGMSTSSNWPWANEYSGKSNGA